jgi:hypothetical protein
MQAAGGADPLEGSFGIGMLSGLVRRWGERDLLSKPR